MLRLKVVNTQSRSRRLVEDIQATVDAAATAGAEVAVPPMEIPGHGTFAIVIQGGPNAIPPRLYQRMAANHEEGCGREEIEPFTFHDLKAKGVSDFEGDKAKASGHKTLRMVSVYDRKIERVEPTK